MELTSGRYWLNFAALGAKALIYVDRGPTPKFFYEDKIELSPVTFPRFRLSLEEARDYFGAFDDPSRAGVVSPRVRLVSDMQWQEVPGKNIYGLIAGADPKLSDHLIIIEAFYDSSVYAARRSPGADEALSIATLLSVARTLAPSPGPFGSSGRLGRPCPDPDGHARNDLVHGFPQQGSARGSEKIEKYRLAKRAISGCPGSGRPWPGPIRTIGRSSQAGFQRSDKKRGGPDLAPIDAPAA
jgi:hypothetical protein